MRAGGDRRGNNADRLCRKLWMLATWNPELGPDTAECQLRISESCVGTLTLATVTADRIDPGGTYRRENVQPACRPCQNRQGALITREKRHQWFAWRAEADAAGIEWDGAM